MGALLSSRIPRLFLTFLTLTLSSDRAIENLAFVLAAAQGGLHQNKRRTWGQSMVVDAWGHVLASQADGAGVVLADIDKDKLAASRKHLPALEHRRL